jgi:hypothetical protein
MNKFLPLDIDAFVIKHLEAHPVNKDPESELTCIIYHTAFLQNMTKLMEENPEMTKEQVYEMIEESRSSKMNRLTELIKHLQGGA